MSKSEQVQDATTTATTPRSRAQAMLLDFLSDHDAACPVCGYNLRALTRPICPECRQDLVLTVGATRLRLEWLLIALAPGFFSGIAAVLVLGLIVVHLVMIGSTWAVIVTLDLFGWCSAALTIILAMKRIRFLAQSRARQRWWAISIWIVHLAALPLIILMWA